MHMLSDSKVERCLAGCSLTSSAALAASWTSRWNTSSEFLQVTNSCSCSCSCSCSRLRCYCRGILPYQQEVRRQPVAAEAGTGGRIKQSKQEAAKICHVFGSTLKRCLLRERSMESALSRIVLHWKEAQASLSSAALTTPPQHCGNTLKPTIRRKHWRKYWMILMLK